MTAIQVGHDFLNFTTDVFESGDRKGTIIDSGTTLAYLSEMVYEPLVTKVCDIKLVLSSREFYFILLKFYVFSFYLWLDTLAAASFEASNSS